MSELLELSEGERSMATKAVDNIQAAETKTERSRWWDFLLKAMDLANKLPTPIQERLTDLIMNPPSLPQL